MEPDYDELENEREEHRHTQGALDYANETLRVTSSAERAERLRLEAEVKRLTVERNYWYDAAEQGRREGYKQGTDEMEAECLRLQQWDEKRIHEMKALEERAERAENALKRIYAHMERTAAGPDDDPDDFPY